MRKITIFFVVAGFLLAVSGTASGTLVDGSERLIEMQNTDGGWGWELTGASATNSAGPCGSGLLSVYIATGDVKYLNAAIKTGEFVIAQPGDGYTYRPSVGIFMKRLSDITGDSKYANAVKTNYYDALENGTFVYKNGLNDTDSYIAYINDARSTMPNIAIWDFGNVADGAAALGSDQAEINKWAAAIETGLNNWNGVYSSSTIYSVLGLSGGIYGLSAMGMDLTNPISSTSRLNGYETVEELADELIKFQTSNGGFSKYCDYLDGYEGAQETAFAIKALEQVDALAYASEIAAAQSWLADVQLPTGGWSGAWAGIGDENNQVTGQVLWAIPEPATIALLGFGGLLLRRRKSA